MKKKWISILMISGAVLLAACDTDEAETDDALIDDQVEESTDVVEDSDETEETDDTVEETEDHGGHDAMGHDQSGEIPEGLEEAEDPTYPVGSDIILDANHISGMDGAEGTIVGAYDTTVYAVSYDPTDGGEPVENHEWVIHEELEELEEDPFDPGDEVTLNARHMDGMEGATAIIDRAEETTVYMVDFMPTDSDEMILNHQWLTEDEIQPAE